MYNFLDKNNAPFVSIIIPLYVISERFFKDITKFDNLKYSNYEILIICDKNIELPSVKNIRLITTGSRKTGPAEKRDIGLKQAKGTICAFIDDDAYPDPLWITRAVRHFIRNKDIIVVGGPGTTPPDDNRMAKLGGLVYESKYTSGKLRMRFASVGERTKEIEDWPAYNLFIRTKSMKQVGGWGSTFYGGEDTYICMKMLNFGRMIYDPKVIVCHHRRPLFYSHLKQIFNVGKHRGFFFKKYPETSRYIIYFLPTMLTFGFWTLVALSFVNFIYFEIFLLLFVITFGMAFSSVQRKTDFAGSIMATFGVIVTHMAYGIGFVKGLFMNKLLR